MNNQIKCFACWQSKTLQLINYRYYCSDCQEKYDSFFINTIPKCEACKKLIKKERVKFILVYDSYPMPIPNVRIGIIINNSLNSYIQSKGSQRKLEGWIYLCNTCQIEFHKQVNPQTAEAFGKENHRLFNQIESNMS